MGWLLQFACLCLAEEKILRSLNLIERVQEAVAFLKEKYGNTR